MAILALGKTRSRREPNLGCKGAHRPGWYDVLPERSLHVSCRMGRRIDADSQICSLGHYECDGHTVHKLSQLRLTAEWLVPRESDCSQMDSKVSSYWLPSYSKATRPVLEIFKMAGYFPDSPLRHSVCSVVKFYAFVSLNILDVKNVLSLCVTSVCDIQMKRLEKMDSAHHL